MSFGLFAQDNDTTIAVLRTNSPTSVNTSTIAIAGTFQISITSEDFKSSNGLSEKNLRTIEENRELIDNVTMEINGRIINIMSGEKVNNGDKWSMYKIISK